jgi:diguanylate cyclase (GGDEF)-like protein/PAS domain S-box-containing protein
VAHKSITIWEYFSNQDWLFSHAGGWSVGRSQREIEVPTSIGDRPHRPAMAAPDGETPTSELSVINARLRKDNMLLRETLDNMTLGVLMFDSDARIVVCNDRYIELYGVSREVVKPGCTLLDLLKHRKATGFLAGNVRKYRQSILDRIKRGEITSEYLTTTDGRTIHVINQPLVDGGWVVTHEDVTQHKQAEAQIAHMAHHDALTDLPNRVLFQAQLEQALRWVTRDEQLAILFIDLDNFKNINDTLGHPIGDALLKIVAERLRGCIRETDAISRLGGDEFVIVQSKVEQPSDVAVLAERIRTAIMAPYDILEHQIVIDTSIGIALSPGDGTTPEQLIKNADMALYGAKASGRGTYRFFKQDMDSRMRARHTLELDLRKALVNGEFEIYYQPLVNLEYDAISCCEALLRWHHPERGIIGPDTFIPVAEESGLIVRIGEWVIRTACMEAAKWSEGIVLAVNVSPVQFKNQNLVQVVTHSLAAAGLPAHRLEIEITEAILIEQTDATLVTLNQLRTLGVRIAMDDFGTGYSSLSYLQKFPFDKIKIDASFISGLSDEAESTAIVRAVTGLAESFHMITTAEGVETEAQLEIVKALGCTEMQGFLFSKACTAAQLLEMLNARNPRAIKAA